MIVRPIAANGSVLRERAVCRLRSPMRRMGGRLLTTLLPTVVACTLPSIAAFAADPASIDGIWLPDASRSQRLPADAPFTPEGRQLVDEWRSSHDPIEDDPGRFCQPPGMPSLALGGADYPIEIIASPHQITILMELHQQVRRIFLNLDSHPDRLFPQRNGHSIGRWENDVLVIDTVGIRGLLFGSVPHSDSVQVAERMTAIEDGAALVNEITITDPVMFAEPIVLRQYYRAAPDDTRMLEYECTEGMWVEHERARVESTRSAD